MGEGELGGRGREVGVVAIPFPRYTLFPTILQVIYMYTMVVNPVNHYRVGLSGSSHSKEKIKHSMVTNQRWQNLISNSGSSVWSCAVLS